MAEGTPRRDGPRRSGDDRRQARDPRGRSGRPSAGGSGQQRDRRPSSGGEPSTSRSSSGRPAPSREGPRPPRGPQVPEGVDWNLLDPAARRELRSLPKELAERVGAHLVASGMALEDDPELALQHAREARRLASRVAVVREAMGLAAYGAGEWAEALAELRAFRRMSGDDSHLALLADCERGLGRPERALELVAEGERASLDPASLVELWLVEAGARCDLGQPEAAALVLDRIKGLPGPGRSLPLIRARYAYADVLVQLGRDAEAREWFSRVVAEDVDLATDAADRLLELDGVSWEPGGSAAEVGADTSPAPGGGSSAPETPVIDGGSPRGETGSPDPAPPASESVDTSPEDDGRADTLF